MHEAETCADRQLIEGQSVGIVVGVVAVQGGLDLLADRVGEGDASRVALQQRLHLGWVKVGVGDNQLAVFLLPLVSVGLYIFVFHVSLEVGSLMQEHPQEKPWIQVSVDADFMKVAVGRRTAVVAQFRHAFACDVEVYFVVVKVAVHPIDRLRRQVVPQYPAVSFLVGQNVGQSQSLRLCRCMFTLLLQAVIPRLHSSTAATISFVIVVFFILMFPKTPLCRFLLSRSVGFYEIFSKFKKKKYICNIIKKQ